MTEQKIQEVVNCREKEKRFPYPYFSLLQPHRSTPFFQPVGLSVVGFTPFPIALLPYTAALGFLYPAGASMKKVKSDLADHSVRSGGYELPSLQQKTACLYPFNKCKETWVEKINEADDGKNIYNTLPWALRLMS